MTPLLEAHGVERSFQIGPKAVQALAPVSLTVSACEFLMITGPSGSGKSTLLNLLSGLDRPTRGDVLFKGQSLFSRKEEQRVHIRNSCFGFIFQTPHLLPDKTILENIGLPFHYGEAADSDDAWSRCQDLLEYVGLSPLAERYPNTLSGGEMQRVVFARALVREPEVIFADEPTGSLDGDNSRRLLELLREQAENGRTIIMVSHDDEALSYGTTTLRLDKFKAG
ncbi:MAG: ABC transporter ATP-binding protein [Thermodesulfobacteriota bacterium]